MPAEILTAVIAALGVVLAAAITAYFAARPSIIRAKRQLADVHTSTVNSHGTDLRHDVDLLKTWTIGIGSSVRRIEGAIDGLRAHDDSHKAESQMAYAALTEALAHHKITIPPWPGGEKE